MQILQAMPLPEAAPQTTAGDANYITSLANKAAMIAIPQLASTKALQPAKKTVYIMLILKAGSHFFALAIASPLPSFALTQFCYLLVVRQYMRRLFDPQQSYL